MYEVMVGVGLGHVVRELTERHRYVWEREREKA